MRTVVLSSSISLSALVLTVLGFALPTSDAHAQPSRPTISVSALGPQVGEVVPNFRLQDQDGTVWTRDAIMGSNGAMIMFHRSADW